MRRLDLNTKKIFSAIFEFSILRWVRGENAKFRKIWIFKHNSALNNSMVKKFHMTEVDLNTNKPYSKNHAAWQRALQIIYKSCRLISHLKNEKKKTFFSLFATNTRMFAPLSSKQYCTEVNDYFFL